jgi:hypothetical protein
VEGVMKGDKPALIAYAVKDPVEEQRKVMQ